MEEYILFNSYEGQTEHLAESRDDLIKFLREQSAKDRLMGEGAYDIFYGKHLQTTPFWNEAFKKTTS